MPARSLAAVLAAVAVLATAGVLVVLAGARPAAAQEADWLRVDADARSVTLRVVAGATEANNRWNFNGYAHGEATVTVPEGYAVELQFANEDPNMAHSVGVAEPQDSYPPLFTDPQPVFEGAITSHAADVLKATAPGAHETIRFTAERAGAYVLLCYVPGHATTGMWIHFVVSADGNAGFTVAE